MSRSRSGRGHDHDAGGDPDVLRARAALRDEVGTALIDAKVAPRTTASIAGATRSARRVTVAELEPVDLVVTGCVAVGELTEAKIAAIPLLQALRQGEGQALGAQPSSPLVCCCITGAGSPGPGHGTWP